MLMVHLTSEDFQRVIMKISSGASCKADGISTIILNRLLVPISNIRIKI